MFDQSYLAKQLEIGKSYPSDLPDELYRDFDRRAAETLMIVANRIEQDVPFTPFIKAFEDTRVKLSTVNSHGEEDYLSLIKDLVTKHHGPDQTSYSKASDYTAVDAGRNFGKMGREVTPGAPERRMDTFQEYFVPTKFEPDGELFTLAIRYVTEKFPGRVAHVKEWKDYKEPFQTTASNVGFPWYRNEKTHDAKGTTYRHKATEYAEYITSKYGTRGVTGVPATLIGRDQRSGHLEQPLRFLPSKARPIGAVARIVNVLVAKTSHPIIEKLKESSYFVAYWDRIRRAKDIAKMDEIAEANGLTLYNVDFSHFDTTVSAELLTAVYYVFSQMLLDGHTYLEAAFASLIKTKIMAYDHKLIIKTKFGKVASGHGYTSAGDSLANLIADTYVKFKLYGPAKVRQIDSLFLEQGIAPTKVAGDDQLTGGFDTKDIARASKIYEQDLGMIVNPSKGEAGAFFLQERNIKGKVIVPFTRVMSKLLGVERPKGFGPALGTLATATKLWLLNENSELADIVRLCYAIDSFKLGHVGFGERITLPQFMDKLKRELEEHKSQRANTPMDFIYDGDPTKLPMWNLDTGNPSSEFLNWFGNLEEKYVTNK